MKTNKEIEQIEKAHKYLSGFFKSIIENGPRKYHVEDFNYLINNIPKFRDVVKDTYERLYDLYLRGEILKNSEQDTIIGVLMIVYTD